MVGFYAGQPAPWVACEGYELSWGCLLRSAGDRSSRGAAAFETAQRRSLTYSFRLIKDAFSFLFVTFGIEAILEDSCLDSHLFTYDDLHT